MNKKGFNLLELMFVIAIIGILAATAAPNMSTWLAKRNLDSSARTMMSHFQQARSEAIKRNLNVGIAFTPATSSYVVMANTTTIVPNTVIPDDIVLATTFTSNSTGFTSRGFAIKSGTVTITSSKAPSANKTRTLTLTLGGSVRIQ